MTYPVMRDARLEATTLNSGIPRNPYITQKIRPLMDTGTMLPSPGETHK